MAAPFRRLLRLPVRKAPSFTPFPPTRSPTIALPITKPTYNPTTAYFHTSPPRQSFNPATCPQDESILEHHTQAIFIDENGAYQGLCNIPELLTTFDRETYTLVCINHTNPPPVIVKLLTKQFITDTALENWRREKERKKNPKLKNPAIVTKEFQITWAIGMHDLEYKLKRVLEYLEKGNRVEVVLGGKKGMSKVTLAQVEELLRRIRYVAADRGPGKEWKDSEGELGMQMVLYFQKKTPEELAAAKIRWEEEDRWAALLAAEEARLREEEAKRALEEQAWAAENGGMVWEWPQVEVEMSIPWTAVNTPPEGVYPNYTSSEMYPSYTPQTLAYPPPEDATTPYVDLRSQQAQAQMHQQQQNITPTAPPPSPSPPPPQVPQVETKASTPPSPPPHPSPEVQQKQPSPSPQPAYDMPKSRIYY